MRLLQRLRPICAASSLVVSFSAPCVRPPSGTGANVQDFSNLNLSEIAEEEPRHWSRSTGIRDYRDAPVVCGIPVSTLLRHERTAEDDPVHEQPPAAPVPPSTSGGRLLCASRRESGPAERIAELWATAKEEVAKHPTIYGISATCLAIFLGWRRLDPTFMSRHFLLDVANVSAGRWWALPLSSLSHEGLGHLGFNLYALHSFGMPLSEQVGERPFAALCAVAGVVSAAASYGHCLWQRRQQQAPVSFLGFSGVAYGIMMLFGLLFPDARIGIVFLPSSLSLPALTGIKAICVLDVLGLLWGRSGLGHAAHLAGAFAGAVFYGLLYGWR
eukprot:jgi/Mesvir1/23450/Mv22300-RA.2